MSTLAVVIPVYNERDGLPTLHARLLAVLDALPVASQVVYADDGSSDGSSDLLTGFATADARVGVVHLSRNFGQQIAIAAGLSMADADAVVVMDADLQDPPELIPELLARWSEGYDVVYAVKQNQRESRLRRLLLPVFYGLLRMLSSVPLPAYAGNFSLMDRAVVRAVNRLPEHNRFLSGMRAWVGGRQTGVVVVREQRYDRRARMSWSKLARMAADALFGFTELPLRLATVTGLVLGVLGLASLAGLLWRSLVQGHGLHGTATIVTALLLLGALQLVALGIVGEYLARTYQESRGRPAWVVARYRNLQPDRRQHGAKSLHEDSSRHDPESPASTG